MFTLPFGFGIVDTLGLELEDDASDGLKGF
jgi:hypothetical protein